MTNDGASEGLQEQAQVLHVVAQIVSLVQDRRYLPGERIPSERDVAERFGVGRGVVREAMAMLESMRYLERRRGSGVFMSPDPDATSLETLVLSARVGLPLSNKVNQDSIEVRRIIEVPAISLACDRRTDENLAGLEAALHGYDPSQANATSASDYDAKFHLALIRCTGNEILTRLVQPFYLMSRPRREAYFAQPERRVSSHEQHIQLYEAVRDRDRTAAEAVMTGHIGRVDVWFNANLTQ